MLETSQSISKEYLTRLINKDAPVIFDIGCYDARDSLEFLSLFKEARLFAFDPLPNLTKKFKQALESNKNFTLVETALGNINGFIEWHNADNHPASSSMKTPKDHIALFKDIKFSKIFNIKCSTLDTWAKNNLEEDTIDLMWVDVNGAEKEFLEGAAETISNKVDYIFIEFSAVGEQRLFDGSYTKDEILSVLEDFEELGVYDFKGNYGNLLLKKRKNK